MMTSREVLSEQDIIMFIEDSLQFNKDDNNVAFCDLIDLWFHVIYVLCIHHK
jgi:hypothetical protein